MGKQVTPPAAFLIPQNHVSLGWWIQSNTMGRKLEVCTEGEGESGKITSFFSKMEMLFCHMSCFCTNWATPMASKSKCGRLCHSTGVLVSTLWNSNTYSRVPIVKRPTCKWKHASASNWPEARLVNRFITGTRKERRKGIVSNFSTL